MVVSPEDAEGALNPASWPFRALRLHPPKRPISWSSRSFNGTRLRVLVDTGASLGAISREDARVDVDAAPVASDFRATVSTAHGSVQVAPVLS